MAPKSKKNDWQSKSFRIKIVFKLDDNRSGRVSFRNCVEIENYVFQMAKTKEEYFYIVKKIILYLRKMDPIKKPRTRMPNLPQ